MWLESTKIIFLFYFAAWNMMPCSVSSWHMLAFCVPCWIGNRFSGEQVLFIFHFKPSWFGSHTFDLCLCFTVDPSLGCILPFPLSLIPKCGSCWYWNFSACLCDIKISFVNEVPCLAIIVQSNKTSESAVNMLALCSPCRGLWDDCQENTITFWHRNKYNSLT